MTRRRLIACVVLLMMVFGIATLLEIKSDEKNIADKTNSRLEYKAYVSHAPIRINSDADFDLQFSNRTISGWIINGTGCGYCIYIGNCSQAFTIKNCSLHNASGVDGFFFGNTGLSLYNTSHGFISSNNCSANHNFGINLTASNINTLTYNNGSNNLDEGISLYYSQNNILADNNCSANYRFGIWLNYNSNNNTLNRNVCFNNNNIGIYITSSNFNTVLNNICSKSYWGIGLFASERNKLAYNICGRNSNDGITIQSNYNTINNNTCINNSVCGISLYSTSKNDVKNNICLSNHLYGINIVSSYSIVTYNNCSANLLYGIFIEGSSKFNRIYHNNFIGNHGAGSVYDPLHVQANDTTGTNFWNTSTEGNYWSDWTGPDNNHDGIVDSAYILDGGAGAQDYHPLANPTVVSEFSPVSIIILSVILITMALAWFRRTR